jgi:membrane protein
LLRDLLRLYREAHVPFFAAALAYYALLSLTPLLLLLVGVFGLLLSGNPALRAEVFQGLEELTLTLFPARPELAGETLAFLTRSAFPLTLGSSLLLWAGSNFFAALSYALGLIFGTPFGLRHRLLGLLMPPLLALSLFLLSLFGLFLGFLLRYVPLEGRALQALLPLFSAFLLFLLTYALFRGLRGFRDLLPLSAGAGVATLLFEGVRLLLPRLLPRSQYELLYGPLAGFVLALLGLYLVLYALLLGAVVARTLRA